jgi:hypothetical protein
MARKQFKDDELADGLETRANIIARAFGVPSYGKCNIIDYPKYSFLIANLICYTNKQFFAYKAVDNNSKVGYLSLKQYRKYSCLMTKNQEEARLYLKNNGRMTTMFKLLKRAIDENPRAHWLKNLKLSEEKLEELSRVLQQDSSIDFIEVPVQEAYDLQLQENRIGSGHRFCTHSCMQGDPVAQFYEHFDVKAYIAKKQNRNIGRFLVWHTEDDKTYVDRLYCHGGEQDDILKAIDKKWKDAIKYPEMEGQHFVKCLKSIDDFGPKMFYPYLDSFMFLINRDGNLVLSNMTIDKHDFVRCQDASGDNPQKFVKCPKCGKLYVRSRYGRNITRHFMQCERSYSSQQEREVYLALFEAFCGA